MVEQSTFGDMVATDLLLCRGGGSLMGPSAPI